MATGDTELEHFKTDIDLRTYAQSLGFGVVKNGTGGSYTAMRNDANDKILVSKDLDNHYIYCSVFNDRDNGSIIDFVQNRKGGSLGDVRKELRPWLSGGVSPTPSNNQLPLPALKPTNKDLLKVQASFEATKPANGQHPYLENERKIPRSILNDPAFINQIRSGKYGNAVFPHYNLEGLCGFEIKNKEFTSFSKFGEKGLWSNQPACEVTTLVIAETAIDALSYAALKPSSETRYISVGGGMNPYQPALLSHIIKKLPENGQVIAAMDNDEGGIALTGKIRGVFEEIKHPTARFVEDRPSGKGEDWNDVLRANMAQGEHLTCEMER